MKTSRTIVGTIGTSAFAVLLSAAVYYFAQARSEGAFWWMVGSGLVCTVCAVVWFILHSSGEKKVKVAPSVTSVIGGDNAGTQSTAAGDIHQHFYAPGTPALLVQAAALPPIPVVSDTHTVPAEEATMTPPTLKISRKTERYIFDPMRSQWRPALSHEGESVDALVLWVHNELLDEGSGREVSLIAQITAQQLETITVARGYWTDRTFNEITLAPGAELGVIVGHFYGNSFIVYDHPHAPPRGYDLLESGFRPRGHRAELELVVRDRDNAAPLTITVKIAQMPGTTVIACKKIVVTLPGCFNDMRDCNDPRGPYRAY